MADLESPATADLESPATADLESPSSPSTDPIRRYNGDFSRRFWYCSSPANTSHAECSVDQNRGRYHDSILASHTMRAMPLPLHLFDEFDQTYPKQHEQQQEQECHLQFQQKISLMPSLPPKLLQQPPSYQGLRQYVSHTTLWGGRLDHDNWAAADSVRSWKDGRDKSAMKCHNITPFTLGLFCGHTRISDFCLAILRDKATSVGRNCSQESLAEAIKEDQHLMVIMQALEEQDSTEECGILLVSSRASDHAVCYIDVKPKKPYVSYDFSSREGAGHGYNSYARFHLSDLASNSSQNEVVDTIRVAFELAARMDDGTGGHVLIYHAEMDMPWRFREGYELPEREDELNWEQIYL